MKSTHKIPAFGYSRFKSDIEHINKNAVKLGLPEIKITILSQEDIEFHDTAKQRRYDPYNIGTHDYRDFVTVTTVYTVEIEGEEPVLEGWKFIASVSSVEKGNIIKTLPEETYPERYRTDPIHCDHCGHKRYRVKAYILKHIESGEFKMIGSTCIKDFFSHNSPQAIAEYAESLWSVFCLSPIQLNFGENEFSFGEGRKIVLEPYLKCVSAVIRQHGWVSKGEAYDSGKAHTAGRAEDVYFNRKGTENIRFNEDDIETVHLALEWIRSFSSGDKMNDYLWNLYCACGEKYIDWKQMGIAASLITTYKREMERQRTIENDFGKSKYMGEIGKKVSIHIQVIGKNELDGSYGVTYLYRMLEKDNLLIWFASNPILEVGSEYDLTGTVKKHEDYKGIKQTILTRCKAK